MMRSVESPAYLRQLQSTAVLAGFSGASKGEQYFQLTRGTKPYHSILLGRTVDLAARESEHGPSDCLPLGLPWWLPLLISLFFLYFYLAARCIGGPFLCKVCYKLDNNYWLKKITVKLNYINKQQWLSVVRPKVTLVINSVMEWNQKEKICAQVEPAEQHTIDSGGIRTHALSDWCLKPAP